MSNESLTKIIENGGIWTVFDITTRKIIKSGLTDAGSTELMKNLFITKGIRTGRQLEQKILNNLYTYSLFKKNTLDMFIIAFEGLDKAGKATQSKLATEYLKEQGFNVMHSEFPAYDTPTGKIIKEFLTTDMDVDKETIELVMAADKQAKQEAFRKYSKSGVDFLILDRYTGSEKAYALADGVDEGFVDSIQVNIHQPDVEIFINIPVEESMTRKGKHNDGVNDRYESDKELLEKVQKNFVNTATHIVNGIGPVGEVFGRIRTILDIYASIRNNRKGLVK